MREDPFDTDGLENMSTTFEKSVTHLQGLFSELFRESEHTILVKGSGDPLYLPVSNERPFAEIQFAHGFFSSALHEIAHWLIAGKDRRLLEDYGYWYRPDGRTREQQEAFESFEARNQGLEWILSIAAGHSFHVSSDNLDGDWQGGQRFAEKVRTNALAHIANGLNGRTKIIVDALIDTYGDRQLFDSFWDAVASGKILPAY